MDRFFISIYRYFSEQKKFFWFCTSIVFGIMIWCATRVRFEEDITKAFPNHPELEKINYVFKNSSLGEKIVVMVSFDDSVKEINPDSLVSFAETLGDSINQYPQYVKPVNVRIDFSRAGKFLDEVIKHLPVFLEEKDYQDLDSILIRNPNEVIRETYLKLSSPLNLYPKKILVQDPLGFSKPILKRLALQLYDENYVLYDNCIVTKDYRHLLFFVQPVYPASETGNNSKLISIIKDRISVQSKIHKEISASFFGSAVVAVSNADQLRSDTSLTLSIMILLLTLLFGFYFRSWKSAIILFVPVIGGALFSLALIFLIKGSISVLAVAAGSIVLGIAVNYSLHFLVQAKHLKNPEEVIAHLTGPLTLGNVTTVLAFLFLQLANAEVLRDIGLFAAFSLMGAALCSLIIVPQLWNMLAKSNSKPQADGELQLNFFSRPWFFYLILLLTPIFAWFSPDVKFNSDMNALSFMDGQAKEAQEKLEQIQGGTLASIFVVSDGQSLKEAIQKNEKLNPAFESIKASGVAKKVNSVSNFLLSDSAQQVRLQRWNSFWKERKEKLTASIERGTNVSKSLVENAISSIAREYKMLDDSASKAIASSLFSEQVISKSGNYSLISILTVPISERAQVTRNLNRQGIFAFDKSSATQMIVSFVKNDFNLILGVSSLVVFIALWLAYKRIELVVISFLPMVITWIWILGIMALLEIEFNMINVMISTFIFGLGDDYSIFVMDGLRQDYAFKRKSLGATNISIVLSALTTIIGLGVLIFAQHPALRSIALISIIGILCVFIMSQTVEPFLFHWLTRARTKKGLPPITLRGLANTFLTYFLFVSGSLLLTFIGTLLRSIPFKRKQVRWIFHQLICWFARALIFVGIKVNWEIMKEVSARFSKPSIFIANHSSFLDILLTIMLHPKLVLFTNRWVWNSPIFGGVVRLAGYLTTQNDFEQNLQQSQQLMSEGYSIVIFPEGSRSPDGAIKRFHKGAFLLAEKLEADIQPLLIYGAWNTIRKNQLYASENKVQLSFLSRIGYADSKWGVGYKERAKRIQNLFKEEIENLPRKLKANYFKKLIISNFRYKNSEAVSEAKEVVQSINFDGLKELIPANGNLLIYNCGFGASALMLNLLLPDSKITAVDGDVSKIELTSNLHSKNLNLRFISLDEFKNNSLLYDVLCMANENSDWVNGLKFLKADGTVIFFHVKEDAELKTKSLENGLSYSKKEDGFVVLKKI